MKEPKSATASDWDADEERQRIGEGKYDGFIVQNVKALIPKLPLPHPEFEDVFQEFAGYALEAIELYIPYRGVKFGTFLCSHLRMRGLQWFNCAWLVRNTPKGRFVTTFSQADDTDHELNERILYDPTRVRDTQLLDCMLNELREQLSPRALQLFEYFVDLVIWDENRDANDVLDCFRSPRFDSRISKLTGLDRGEVCEVIEEISHKARRYVAA